MRLAGKSAVVTGAGAGIGRASALLFAAEGAKVCVADIDGAAAEETVGLIRAEGGNAFACVADVSLASDVERMVGGAHARFGRLDVLFNNAGIPVRPTPVELLEEEVWDRLLAVNLKSVFLACKCAIPIMKGQKGGSIVNTASISGIRPRPGSLPYCTAKAGVIALTKALAIELAPHGVRVNCLSPVATDTQMLPQLVPEGAMGGMVAGIPLGRLGRPGDIAKAALYLASDDASLVTGISLNIDGGRGI